jgi:hypothetical protein
MTFRQFAKTTYLMLMMVDRDGHVPVLRRDDRGQAFDGSVFAVPAGRAPRTLR